MSDVNKFLRGKIYGRRQHQSIRRNHNSASHSDKSDDRPKHLRGKEIGLYYARKNKLKKEAENKRPLGTVILSKEKKCHIEKLLKSVDNSPFYVNSGGNDAAPYDSIKDSEFKRNFLQIIHGSFEDNFKAPELRESSALNTKYATELKNVMETNNMYKKLLQFRQKLPSYEKRSEIIDLINNNQVIVISGETGCGKTTQVPQFILDDQIMKGNGSRCKIVCTQPRRISAISIAERVSEERGEKHFESVGYQIRLEKKLPRQFGSITFCTTGVLLKQMELDPYISNISHLILDEIHERDTVSDIVILLLKQIITKRKDLKLVLMSATLNAEQFSKYFNNCPIMNIPGFTFPVECYYLEHILSFTKFSYPNSSGKISWRRIREQKKKWNEFFEIIEPHVRNLKAKRLFSDQVLKNLENPYSEELNLQLIVELLKYICAKDQDNNAVLIFLPGISDIWNLSNEIKKQLSLCRYLLLTLHSKLPAIQQHQIFDRPPQGVRKIVIATNIAETSITIDDIVYVIDCGKIKITNYDVENNIETLKPEWVSLANASQRKGRAGRVQPGICYHMFSQARKMFLESYQKPEIQRSRLENTILTIKILKLGNITTFLNNLMDPPEPEAIQNALDLLVHVNAIDSEEQLTPLGYHLARLPVNPYIGKMILLGALFSCLDPILSIAASLDFKDAFQILPNMQQQIDAKKQELLQGWKSDHLLLAKVIQHYEAAKAERNDRNFCWEYFLNSSTLELLINMKEHLAQYLCAMNFLTNSNVKDDQWNQNSENLSLVKAIVSASLYPNVAVIKKVNRAGRKRIVTENEKVELHLNSVNAKETYFESPLLVYYLKLKSNVIFLHDTSMIYPLPLLFFGDKLNIETYETKTVISISRLLRFKSNEETALLIKNVRNQLDNLLKYKISHPGIINWMEDNNEVTVLRAIMELITSEDTGLLDMYDDEDDSDCD